MKEKSHPDYQEVLFVDSSTGEKFVTGSTQKPKEKEMFNGKEYPVVRVAVSSASHPFFTGSKQIMDAEGRLDKFKKRYEKKNAENAAAVIAQDAEKPVTKKKKK